MGPLQTWKRIGLIFRPEHQRPWLHSHAACPTPLVLDDGTIRVYFSPRDEAGRSSIASLDLHLEGERHEILRLAELPLLAHGPRGAFDDSGTTIGSVVRIGDQLFAYYLGWNLGVTAPYRNFIGLARGCLESQTWTRFLPAPLVERSKEDPYSLSYPWVMRGDDGWRMWYGSQLGWGDGDQVMAHAIRQAFSSDGLDWRRDGYNAVPAECAPCIGSARPCVILEDGRYRMWYSRRSLEQLEYSPGYAESSDGHTWHPIAEGLHFIPEANPWDGNVIAYPCVFRHRGRFYMFYNGEAYGRSGFGLAILAE